MRLGSLCTGYGGLDLGVEMTVGPIRHAWHAEIDPDASRVLAAHWPDVPNLGDLTAVDWTRVEPVDILTAGFPCQPVSTAGRRKGVNDERWLWDDIADAVGRMDPRPRMLVLENVPGLLTANRGHAMARVVQRLAALGYVGRYRTVRASDIGAPHRRERVFVVAWPADDAEGVGHRDIRLASIGRVAAAAVAGAATHADRDGRQGCRDAADARGRQPHIARCGAGHRNLTLLPTPIVSDANGPPLILSDSSYSQLRDRVLNLLPTPTAAQGRGAGAPSRKTAERRMYAEGRRFLDDAVALLPSPRAGDGRHGGPGQRSGNGRTDLALPSTVVQRADRWGDYGPAIARWEQVIGRPAPDPTEPGTKGQPRLSPRFVEWLMGLPDGWVTDHLPRNPALRVLGNGVVPQQAAAALEWLVSP